MRTVIAAVAAFALAGAAAASDPKEKIVELQENARVAAERGMEALKGEPSEASFAKAASEFGFAQQYMSQAKGFFLAARLPGDTDGWTAAEVEVVSVGAAALGGGTSIERSYEKGGETVTLRIIADSPMVSGMMAMISNPMFAMASSGSGNSSAIIGGERAMVEDQGDGEAQVSMPVGATLYQGEGPLEAVKMLMEKIETE